MANAAFKITNTNGLTGPVWEAEYETRGDAGEAIRQALGWDGLHFSPAFTVTHPDWTDAAPSFTTAFAVYETSDECEADGEAADAPRIVKIRG